VYNLFAVANLTIGYFHLLALSHNLSRQRRETQDTLPGGSCRQAGFEGFYYRNIMGTGYVSSVRNDKSQVGVSCFIEQLHFAQPRVLVTQLRYPFLYRH